MEISDEFSVTSSSTSSIFVNTDTIWVFIRIKSLFSASWSRNCSFAKFLAKSSGLSPSKTGIEWISSLFILTSMNKYGVFTSSSSPKVSNFVNLNSLDSSVKLVFGKFQISGIFFGS